MAVKIFTQQITSWDKLPVLLDIGTVCCLLQCSEVTVVRHIKAGHFKGNKLGSAWRIDRDSVRAYFTGEVTNLTLYPHKELHRYRIGFKRQRN